MVDQKHLKDGLAGLSQFGVSVFMIMPGATGVEHEARSLGWPSASTTHSLQPP